MPPNPKLLDRCISDASRPADVGHIIEVALGVGDFLVDGGMEYLVPDAQGHDTGFDGTGRAKEVPDHGFGGTDCQLAGVFSENGTNRRRLGPVVRRRRGSVCVDVVDVLGSDAGPAQGHLHRYESHRPRRGAER